MNRRGVRARRLFPLWLALVRSSPEIALVPPSPWAVDALAVRALRAKAQRRPAAGGPEAEASGGSDLDAEVGWLVEVADCYSASPLVRAVVGRLEREARHGDPGRVVSDRP